MNVSPLGILAQPRRLARAWSGRSKSSSVSWSVFGQPVRIRHEIVWCRQLADRGAPAILDFPDAVIRSRYHGHSASPADPCWRYILKQRLLGRGKYPLVLMLEPLFRCNLACAGCGKIDYPTPILNRRLSVQECLDAVDEVRRASRVDSGRRALDPQGDRRDRPRPDRAQKVRLPVHQRASGREEDRSVRAQPIPHLLDPSGWAARASTIAPCVRMVCSIVRSPRSGCCASAAFAST